MAGGWPTGNIAILSVKFSAPANMELKLTRCRQVQPSVCAGGRVLIVQLIWCKMGRTNAGHCAFTKHAHLIAAPAIVLLACGDEVPAPGTVRIHLHMAAMRGFVVAAMHCALSRPADFALLCGSGARPVLLRRRFDRASHAAANVLNLVAAVQLDDLCLLRLSWHPRAALA